MANIAGNFITSVGGYVGFCPWLGNTTPEWTVGGGGPVPPTTSVVNGVQIFDVADWELETIPFFDDTTHTGSYGAQSIDKVAEGFTATINAIVDQRYPPDMYAKYGFGFQNGTLVPANLAPGFDFNLGTRMTLVVGAGVSSPADGLQVDFYWCPSVKVATVRPTIDANNKKMVRMRVDVVGNAKLFKLPAEYQVFLGYQTHLQGRGSTF